MPVKRVDATNFARDEDGEPYRCEWCGASSWHWDKRTEQHYRSLWRTDGLWLCVECHENYSYRYKAVLTQGEWDKFHSEEGD